MLPMATTSARISAVYARRMASGTMRGVWDKNKMTSIMGIELSEDEIIMAEDMELKDYLYEDDDETV